MAFCDFLICPLCAAPLVREGASLFCTGARKHCYDIASSGYVNLLPPGKGKNARTGDDAGMIAARTAFLTGGYYDVISDAVAEIAATNIPKREGRIALLDAGSGEGYHTCRIARGIASATGRHIDALGVDASKKGAAAGAKLAARTAADGADISFAAGNIFSLPVKDHSLDVMLSLFAPIPAAEAMRTLKDDGILVVTASAARHLWEMRCLLYDEVREGNAEAATPEGFVLKEKREVRALVHIPDNGTLMHLFTMTPFYYRTPESGRARLASTESLDVSVMADLYVFTKRKDF
ncbi:MAG: methyltransferase domain-containing protein [Clostridia bacterium]|nr:methyltransferase domain-containing protein [Clostridia bacterium]